MGCLRKSFDSEDGEFATNRPSDSKFKQQKLPAWQPILTASTVLPLFFFIGIVFLPIGITLMVTSNNIREKVIDYTDAAVAKDCEKCFDVDITSTKNPKCQCEVEFSLEERWDGDVYFYYGLSNFYQNHRRYVRSRDDTQLNGQLSQTVNTNCAPYDKDAKERTYAPCGAIANSMFNDKFTVILQSDNGKIPLTAKDIAWKSDRDVKFNNPSDLTQFNNYVRPKRWMVNVTDLVGEDPDDGVAFENQDFIIWMRVAAFPTFRKLYRKLDRLKTEKFSEGLPMGKYKLLIDFNFPVESFGGKKQFILSTPSWIGAKNPFLGIAYIVVGCLCLIFGFVFLIIHMKIRTRPLTA